MALEKHCLRLEVLVYVLQVFHFFNAAAKNKKKIVTIGLKNQSLYVAAIDRKFVLPVLEIADRTSTKNSGHSLKDMPAVFIKINL